MEIRKYPGSLHNHTDWSNERLNDCIVKYKDLIDYAIELGHEVVAFTDHESISGSIKIQKYYNEIKKKNQNFKVILGNEIYLCRNGLSKENFERGQDKYYHFILLAKDAIGHQQIREISTQAWMRSYKTGKMRRVPTYYSDLENIIKKDPGHVIASSACLGGYLPSLILKFKESKDSEVKDTIYDWIEYIQSIFGKENFYLELQPSDSIEQTYVNRFLVDLSAKMDIPYIITTDTHYLKEEDREIHKAFLNSQDGEREVDSFYATTFLMSTEQLEDRLDLSDEELQYAYDNINKIKNECTDYNLLKPLRIPELIWKVPEEPQDYSLMGKIPFLKTFLQSSYEGDKILAKTIINKINGDKKLQDEKIYSAVDECLKMTWDSSNINKVHWSAYYLNLQKIIDTCWEAGSIVGPGRGSGVGFILLYLLDITQINPVWETTKTFSWRFLNPSRVSVLDVDFDIEGSKRADVLKKFRKVYGEDRVANVITFRTEKSKAAILTAARGLGIDIDEAQYIASLVPADRGMIRSLSQCYYGDEEFKPISSFVKIMDEYPLLWATAKKIEGLISGIGIHAGGVIFVDEPFTNSTALKRAPDETIITAYDLHDCEDCSLIKYDALSVEAEDKIHTTLDLLCEYGHIKREKTLKETYEKVIGVYNLERNAKEMWQMVWNHKILSLFQMEEQSGIQGIKLTKPQSVEDLAHLNSVIRLMAQKKGAEQPVNKFARFKRDITLWYKEMDSYGLTKEEQNILKPYVESSYGIAESQECFMQLVQIPECGGFDLNWADRLRKSIAKKNPKEYNILEQEYFKNAEEKHLSKNLCNYVWKVLVATSKGYGFNLSHTLAYSLVALQEMNLAYKFPLIYWNCACLINDSGGANYNEEDLDENDVESQNTNYDKIAKAIGKMRSEGVHISLADINKSEYGFIPDEKNNTILFGLKGMLNINDEIIGKIIKNRPYDSVADFYNKIKPKKQEMISLIKGGAFDSFKDRKLLMGLYLWETCDKKNRITLQNMNALIKKGLIPEELLKEKSIFEFNRYLKNVCEKDEKNYYFNERAYNFFEKTFNVSTDSIEIKTWEKMYKNFMEPLREWMKKNQQQILDELNKTIFAEAWEKYGEGTLSSWEMETLCFYYHEHELIHVDKQKYGIVNFFDLPDEPEIDCVFRKGDRTIPIYSLTKICGTCIAKNKAKGTVKLLTPEGVVDVKFNKEYFSLFDKQISRKNPDGTKTIVEKSWFNRGSMLLIQGIKKDDVFIPKKYKTRGSAHRLYKIDKINKDGSLLLRGERAQEDE